MEAAQNAQYITLKSVQLWIGLKHALMIRAQFLIPEMTVCSRRSCSIVVDWADWIPSDFLGHLFPQFLSISIMCIFTSAGVLYQINKKSAISCSRFASAKDPQWYRFCVPLSIEWLQESYNSPSFRSLKQLSRNVCSQGMFGIDQKVNMYHWLVIVVFAGSNQFQIKCLFHTITLLLGTIVFMWLISPSEFPALAWMSNRLSPSWGWDPFRVWFPLRFHPHFVLRSFSCHCYL